MRIARIIEYFPPHIGGMERHGLILSQEQIRLGHDVDVFIGHGDDKPRSDLGDFLRSDLRIYKMPFQFLPLYSKIRRIWFNFWACNKVEKIHQKNPFDIIHLHGDFVEAYFGSRLGKKIKIKTILTIHGGLNPAILNQKNAKIFNDLNHIICVSEEIKNDLISCGVNSKKLTVISSGIYLHEFLKPKPELELSKPIIISVGILTKQKGFEYLLEAFREVKKSCPNASLLIVGDGPEKTLLQKNSQNINGVRFLGDLKHEKVVEFLLGSDIFVLSSISMSGYHEGTPTSLMEAMAAGLPIAATKSGGIPYLIRDNSNGLLVEEKNSEALARAITKLINDENLRQKMRDKNLEDAKEKDWPIIAKQITDVYFKTWQ